MRRVGFKVTFFLLKCGGSGGLVMWTVAFSDLEHYFMVREFICQADLLFWELVLN
jgi:pyridoxal/pyridoxine/pyridoxamine kinase